MGGRTFFNFCCGYTLQSFCSKAAKRISTAIRQPLGEYLFSTFIEAKGSWDTSLGEDFILDDYDAQNSNMKIAYQLIKSFEQIQLKQLEGIYIR